MFKPHSGMRYATLLLVLLVALGCRNRRNQPEETTPALPTPVGVDSAPTPTFTPPPDLPPDPTDTPVPAEPTATDTPAVPQTVAIVQSNLRQGPSTFYPIVGQVEQHDAVEVVAQSPDLQWLKLANDAWIYKPLVAGVPADLPIATGVVATPQPTAVPRPTATPTPVPTSTRTPTPTPTPARGDWGKEVPLGSAFNAPGTDPPATLDGLVLKVVEGIYDPAELDFLHGVAGTNRCDQCFAVKIDLKNVAGNNIEYVVLEDFYLVKRVASQQAPVRVASPKECAEDALPSQANPGNLLKLSKGMELVIQEHICFRGVPDEEVIIRETYFLVYEPQFDFIPPPTPVPELTPTSTPSRDVVVSKEPLESEQGHRRGWKVYYALR
ncbi:MAG: SH3 domain-containing protein [Caldilineaceae bacterium]|nr:SH3 domain-containing protein [Caldilineaceae bacterium]